MRKAPIGIQDFKKIRELDLHYVDKTGLIDDVLSDYSTEAFLFTRPRRFGKSVNLSMLDAYLNMDYAGNTWFDGLRISELRPDDPEKNAHPIIYIDLKEASPRTYESFMEDLGYVVSRQCKRFRFLLDSDRVDEDDKEMLRSLIERRASESVLSKSLSLLSLMLEAHLDRKTIVLIDEYDDPINRSHGCAHQHAVLEFFRDFLSSALKGDGSLRFCVITGVMQIAKESIFSGVNNLRVNSILSTDSDEMFGFTPEEVQDLCVSFGHPERYDEAREWYDGYRFGDAEIYNPWSVLMYVNEGSVPATYWVNTSGNEILDDLLSIHDSDVYDDLMILGSGGSKMASLNPYVTFEDVSDRTDSIYSVMAMSGYLRTTPEDGGYALSIPNREIYGVFADKIVDRMGVDNIRVDFGRMSRTLLTGDCGSLERATYDLLASAVSSRVLTDEHSYQGFITGLLMSLFGNYRVTADMESGMGYHDIRLERMRGNGPNVVMEIKRGRSDDATDEELRALADRALDQAISKDYAHGLKGRTAVYGVAFRGKVPTISSAILENRF